MSSLEFNKQLLGLRGALEYFAIHLTMNDEDAKDLLQETFVKALSYRTKFRDKTNLKAWLYTIMKNTFINNYRRTVKARTIMDTTKDQYFLNASPQTSQSISPEAIYSYGEIVEKIEDLPEEYRVPFSMHNDGFKYKEIADELGLPIGTVKSRIFLARKKLMEGLKAYKAA